MFETNRTDLDKIFVRSIEYLLDALRARRDVCKFLTIQRFEKPMPKILNHWLHFQFAEFTLKTLKNELTRRVLVSLRFRKYLTVLISKAYKNKREFIDMQLFSSG